MDEQKIRNLIYEFRCSHPKGAHPMTLSKFADECGISRNTLNDIVVKGQSISLRNAVKIANFLGVSLDDLAGRQ